MNLGDIDYSKQSELDLTTIKSMPVTHDGIHESVFRVNSILECVLKMIERGDSKETILEIADYLRKT